MKNKRFWIAGIGVLLIAALGWYVWCGGSDMGESPDPEKEELDSKQIEALWENAEHTP